MASYSVTITNPNTSIDLSNSANWANAGFIDSKTYSQYANGAIDSSGVTASFVKQRGNVRFGFLQQQLQFEQNIYISNVVTNNAPNSNPALATVNSITFVATMERSETPVMTRDENNSGVILTGNAAIKRMVARALVEGSTNLRAAADPTGSGLSYGESGTRANAIHVVAQTTSFVTNPIANSLSSAESLVSVTAL
jgi:hypothetical protein